VKRTIKSAEQIVQERQHARFVRDAIARSLLTLPYAQHDAADLFGTIYGYYKQLMDAAIAGVVPPTTLLMALVETIREDASIHEAAGNHLKAGIERRWSEGLLLHFSCGQEATP
jgi:hypothetical protein